MTSFNFRFTVARWALQGVLLILVGCQANLKVLTSNQDKQEATSSNSQPDTNSATTGSDGIDPKQSTPSEKGVENGVSKPQISNPMQLTQDASDGFINLNEKSLSHVIFALSLPENYGASFTGFRINENSDFCNESLNYDQTAIPHAGDLPPADGPYVICVRIVDREGLVTFFKSPEVIQDTTPPDFTSLSLANGAADGFVNQSEFLSPAAAVVLTASGYATALYSNILSDTPTVICDESQSYLNDLVPAISDTPPTDGQYGVCVKLTDQAGNVTYGKSQILTRDITLPSINLTMPLFIQGGGSAYNIAWTMTESNASNLINHDFSVSFDDGSQLIGLTNLSATNQSQANLSNQSFSYGWTVNVAEGSGKRIRITYTDLAGNQTIKFSNSFAIDTSAPVITTAQFTANGGGTTVLGHNLNLALRASDSYSNVTHFCFKTNSNVAPLASDSCWIAVDHNPPGLTPASSLNLSTYAYRISYLPNTYVIYAWVKDSFGYMSSLSNGGAGTEGTDRLTLALQPSPPRVSQVIAASSDAPGNPSTISDRTIAAGQTVFIKWRLVDNEALPANPVSIEYTTDNLNFISVASSLTNGVNGSCLVNNPGTTADDSATGCYAWSGGSPSNSYYRIRVRAIDAQGIGDSAQSDPINNGSFNLLAGNIDVNVGVNSLNVNFASYKTTTSLPDNGSFVITSQGVLYIRDPNLGILTVNQTTGLMQMVVRKTGAISGDNGPVSAATLNDPLKIALDHQDRILVFDYDRIRRIDTNANPMTISTVIGGGGNTADGIAATDVQITYPGSRETSSTTQLIKSLQMPFFGLPNGDIYFQSENYSDTPANGVRYRIYHASTGLVDSRSPSGTGFYNNAATAITTYANSSLGVVYDGTTSNLQNVLTQVTMSGVSYPAQMNINTFVSEGPHPAYPLGGNKYMYPVQAMNGKLYYFGRSFNSATKIGRYDSGTNSWVILAGTSAHGTCPEGTVATSCTIDPQDVFVTANDKVYFLERGKIKTIAPDNKVYTVFGQGSSYGDNSDARKARFEKITSVDGINDGRIVIFDLNANHIREFTPLGNIQNIAGDGSMTEPNATTLATNQGMITNRMVTNFSTGEVYADCWIFTTADTFGLCSLDRSTGMWKVLAGSTGGTNYWLAADGTLGNSVKFTYWTVPLGFDGANLLSYSSHYTTSVRHAMLKSYASSNGAQTHVAGVTGATAGTWCASGSATSGCKVPDFWYYEQLHAWWDSGATTPRWIMTQRYESPTKVRGVEPGGVMTELGTITQEIEAAAYRRVSGPTNEIVYFCSNDGNLYKYSITNATTTPIAWPSSSYRCVGDTMYFNAARQSIIFPFVHQGQYGVAEYYDP